MTAGASRDPAELERENRALDEQVKLLVKTEQRLYRSRLELDRQLARTQVLERFALDCASGLDPHQILALGVRTLNELFTFDWCSAIECQGSLARTLSSTHPEPESAAPAEIGELLERLATAPTVAALRLPRDLDPRLLQPLWPASAAPQVSARDSWLVVMRIAERTAPAPTFVVAHALVARSFHTRVDDGRIEGGGSYLYLFATHLERALENAWLTQALRQRTEELGSSLTELQRTQERLAESAKLEAIGRLAGGVAHDFNNLLTVIGGHATLMAAGLPRGDAAHAHVAKITIAVEKGASITSQLLAFGRRSSPARAAIDLNELVSATTQMLGRLLGEHVELQLQLEDALPSVAADRVQLDQVLLNLLVNARDALPDGGTVRVTTRAAGAGDLARATGTNPVGDFVLLEISDDGPGMDEETRARIFEPLYSTKGPGQGGGIGLAIVYGIVRQADGHIFVESAPGRGATFGILLPVAPGVAAAVKPPSEAPRGRVGAHILLVEDDPMIRDVARRFLENAGHRVTEAANGREALAVFEREAAAIDLLLTDVIMPGMGGMALARELRGRHPALRVLYMSGYSQDLAQDPAHHRSGAGRPDGGPEQFAAKPFTAESLLTAVAAALGARSGQGSQG